MVQAGAKLVKGSIRMLVILPYTDHPAGFRMGHDPKPDGLVVAFKYHLHTQQILVPPSARIGVVHRECNVVSPGNLCHCPSLLRPRSVQRDQLMVTCRRGYLLRRLLDGLAAIGRLVLFDRSGIGLSDPITDWSRPPVEQWTEDLDLIVNTVCKRAPVVVSLGDYWGPARLFAGRNTTALSALVLYEPTGPAGGVDLSRVQAELSFSAEPRSGDLIATVCPSRSEDRLFRQWFDDAGHAGASPGTARRFLAPPPAPYIDVLIAAQKQISVPTLVLRRPGHLLGSHRGDDPVATQIPGARCVHIGSADYHWLGEDIDSILHEVSRFVTGHSRLPSPERVLCAVLFTDLVGSTERAYQLGDARWKSLLERHDRLITDEVERRGGRIVKTTGDGVLATLQSADRALRAAAAIRDGLSAQGLSVRIGVHVGDVERRANDVAGMGVHLAARVMSLAGPGEVFVTASVPMAVAGSHHRFELVGNRTLKGVPEEAAVFREIRPDDPMVK